MCDGKGTRWNNYQNTPKHFVKIDGEPLLKGTIRKFKTFDSESEIIITSHDSRYDLENSRRYEPKNNILEIDRFTRELIEDDICFLYGDTFYSDKAVEMIVREKANDILFFGNEKSIVAIKIANSKQFMQHLDIVKRLYQEGKIKECKGWQVYQSFMNLEFDKKQIDKNFVILDDNVVDFNTPKEYETCKLKKGS